MTILQINKFYYPRRGADVMFLEIAGELARRGHTVVPFSMRHPQNLPSPYESNFLSFVETERVSFGWPGLRAALRMLYSLEARRKIRTLARTTRPDLAHLHNIYYQISPSVISQLRRLEIPMIMTVHDWSLLAPKHILFDQGAFCERGLKNPWEIVGHKCVKDSKIASTWAAMVFSLHRKLGLYRRGISRYIAPSIFMKEQLVGGGFSEDKITVIPHFFDAAQVTEAPEVGEYVGYLGAFSSEKGVQILLAAALRLPKLEFRLAGDGPYEAELRRLAGELGLRNVVFVGKLQGTARIRFLRNALCLVMPSLTYESFGLVALEAYAAAKPVVASRIGALPEVVRDGATGILVETGNADALAEAIGNLVQNQAERGRMGRAGRALLLEEYNPELHYERIIEVYREVRR